MKNKKMKLSALTIALAASAQLIYSEAQYTHSKGKIINIMRSNSERELAIIVISDDVSPNINCHFDRDEMTGLLKLKLGDVIKLKGLKPMVQSNGDRSLEHCKL